MLPTCGDGQANAGEQCGEPGLPPCPQGQTCGGCQCLGGGCGDGTVGPGEQCESSIQCPVNYICQSCMCVYQL